MLIDNQIAWDVAGAKMLEDGEQLFHYVMKREFAEGAIMMTSFDFPAKALQFDNLTGMPRMYRWSMT